MKTLLVGINSKYIHTALGVRSWPPRAGSRDGTYRF
jgi:hypothetical protein